MSLEAALEEERKEVEDLIVMQARKRAAAADHRSPSPLTSPRSPVRSMLDIDASNNGPRSPTTQPPVRSMLDIDGPVQQPRSMLDVGGMSTYVPTSAHTSPTLSYKAPAADNTSRNRSMSDVASNPIIDLGPRSPPPMNLSSPRNNDPTSAYKFHDILPTNVGQAMPGKRGQASGMRSSSIGEALRGPDLSNLVLPGEHSRFSRKNKSKSPSSRFNLRSNSPFNPTGRNQQQDVITLKDGQVLDMNNAYRKLSDANLLYGGSGLASLARKRTDNDGHGRIEKDNLSPYGELLPDESDDDVANSSDEEMQRGRKLTTRAESQDQTSGGDGNTAKSLLAAIEDERKHVNATQPKYRSLFDEPEITVTGPSGDRARPHKGKPVVQPSTSFDQEPLSGTQTPLDPDLDADVDAIRAAQKLQLSSTPILSTPEVHRSIRILYRGEFNKIQREAEEEHRRLRKYLVATDLSDESTHALEWAVGTVLRDGDTLIAMYCMDEEASGSVDAGNMVPDEPKAMKEQAVAISALSKGTSARPPNRTASPGPWTSMSPAIRALDGSGSNNPSPAPSSRGKSRLQEERDRAVQDITERVSKLLRKTQLQVRVIVEVIHCKNPKHLITEVIDILSPTLVILGSRGRSALKGTLLGSFSNYLVTKSSVPVMVARKRLRKKSKYQPPPLKQVNNLANPSARSLETARVD